MILNLPHSAQPLDRDDTATDAWGNPQPVWAPAGDPLGAWLQHVDSQEIPYAGDTVLTDWFVMLDPAAEGRFNHLDRLRISGVDYEIIGKPELVEGRRGVHHVEARLKAVS